LPFPGRAAARQCCRAAPGPTDPPRPPRPPHRRIGAAAAVSPTPAHGSARMAQPSVYILASGKRGTLYVGVTTRLAARREAHRSRAVDGFTARYGVDRLVHIERYDDIA